MTDPRPAPDLAPRAATTVASPVGPLTLVAGGGYLLGLTMAGQRHTPAHPPVSEEGGPGPAASPVLAEAAAQLDAYFAGRLTRFDLPLRLVGTEFQRAVWAALAQIPYGATQSYAEVATTVGNPRACRAVGLANGANPVAIVIPCHRVVGAGGGLGGYGGGVDRKAWLLDLEQRTGGRGEEVSFGSP
ncbi:MAG: methylated-DNA--[protein]-cysteine S-methyltransferase [Acidimicrobiales bacterium]